MYIIYGLHEQTEQTPTCDSNSTMNQGPLPGKKPTGIQGDVPAAWSEQLHLAGKVSCPLS